MGAGAVGRGGIGTEVGGRATWERHWGEESARGGEGSGCRVRQR